MCCSMEYDIRFILLHYRIDPVCISYRTDESNQIKFIFIFTEKFLLDLISIVLINIEYNELLRIVRSDLTAKF